MSIPLRYAFAAIGGAEAVGIIVGVTVGGTVGDTEEIAVAIGDSETAGAAIGEAETYADAVGDAEIVGDAVRDSPGGFAMNGVGALPPPPLQAANPNDETAIRASATFCK